MGNQQQTGEGGAGRKKSVFGKKNKSGKKGGSKSKKKKKKGNLGGLGKLLDSAHPGHRENMSVARTFQLENPGMTHYTDQVLAIDESLEECPPNLKINPSMFQIDFDGQFPIFPTLLDCLDLEIIKMIGKGGSNSFVYKAQWQMNEIAFKCFIIDGNIQQDGMDAFEKESSLFASLSRDLKPKNVLIGKDHSSRLMDFGLSKFYDQMSVSKTGRIGTPLYMSPEITRGRCYTTQSDVFSFGIMLYTVLSGMFRPYRYVVEKSYSGSESESPNTTRSSGSDSGGSSHGSQGKSSSRKMKKKLRRFEGNESPNNISRQFSFGVEFRVANDPKFRPDCRLLPKEIPKWAVRLMRKCWRNEERKRPDFVKIMKIFSECTKRAPKSDMDMDNVFVTKPRSRIDLDVTPLYIKKPAVDVDAADVTIHVDYHKIKVPAGTTILEACEKHFKDQSMYIPTLCSHPLIPNIGKCNVCKVWVEKPKPRAADSSDSDSDLSSDSEDEEEAMEGELLRACQTTVSEGMLIETARSNNEKVKDNLRGLLTGLLNEHDYDCDSCKMEGRCTFHTLIKRYKIKQTVPFVKQASKENEEEDESESEGESPKKKQGPCSAADGSSHGEDQDIDRHQVHLHRSKCVKCHRCVRACHFLQNMCFFQPDMDSKEEAEVLDIEELDQDRPTCKNVDEFHDKMFKNYCIHCGQCSFVCPVGALVINDQNDKILKLLRKKKRAQIRGKSSRLFIAQVAPSVRITIGEEYDLEPGEITEGKLVEGLKLLGFDYVFDTNIAADLCTIEEAYELIQRKTNPSEDKPLPMFTSCCPAWVNFCEMYCSKLFPDVIKHISSCKSPHQMLGALVKNYWAQKYPDLAGKKKRIVMVSIMPCVGKKDEMKRPQLRNPKGKDVDFVVTTREVKRLFDSQGIVLPKLKKERRFDSIFGGSSGAGQIFGTTGGVMESALRTAAEMIFETPLKTSNQFNKIREDYADTSVRLIDVKIVSPKKQEVTLKTAIAHKIRNIRRFLYQVKESQSEIFENIDFVEMMSCPQGCLGGAGNPKFMDQTSKMDERREAIFKLAASRKLDERSFQRSHINPQWLEFYEDFITGEYGSLHQLLHTSYENRSTFGNGQGKKKVKRAIVDEEEEKELKEKLRILKKLIKFEEGEDSDSEEDEENLSKPQ